MHSADGLVMCLGDINGHSGGHINGFNEVQGGCRSEEFGRGMSSELCLEKELCATNPWLMREKKT